MTPQLFISTPCFGHMITEVYHISVLRLLHHLSDQKITYKYHTISGESLITRARNGIAAIFLGDPNNTHLMMIDSDVKFEPEFVTRMLGMDRPIVAGIYPKKKLHFDRIRKISQDDIDPQSKMLDYAVNFLPGEQEAINNALKVKDAATGFMMVQRHVFERLIEAHPELKYTDNCINDPRLKDLFYGFFDTMIDPENQIYLSEDFAFCRRWQALGGDVCVDIDSIVEHYGSHLFKGNPFVNDGDDLTFEQPYQYDLRVNHGAGGLGDALLGLLAIGGLKKKNPTKKITYRVHKDAIPFVNLFHGGYNDLCVHNHDQNKDEPPDRVDLQLNVGYNNECRTQCAVPRWERYCRNIDAQQVVMPTLKNRDRLLEPAKEFKGFIALSPFGTWKNREYPLLSWLTVEKLLLEHGYQTVILDKTNSRGGAFKGKKLFGGAAEMVASTLLNCEAVISGDSGLAHLTGIMGVATIVLCGQTEGEKIFGMYPNMHYLKGKLACTGCWWQPPYHSETCDPHCPSLTTITPQEIFATVQQIHSRGIINQLGNKAVITPDRLSVLINLARETAKLEGEMAELGVFRGGSAKAISTACPSKKLHLFDTFTGIPETDEMPGGHKKGDFADTDLNEVRDYLSSHNVEFHVGFFPDTTEGLKDVKYSFVHIDGDTLSTTTAALLYFWKRMVPGGVMVFDDWQWKCCPGVEQAIKEMGLESMVRETAKWQCKIVKP